MWALQQSSGCSSSQSGHAELPRADFSYSCRRFAHQFASTSPACHVSQQLQQRSRRSTCLNSRSSQQHLSWPAGRERGLAAACVTTPTAMAISSSPILSTMQATGRNVKFQAYDNSCGSGVAYTGFASLTSSRNSSSSSSSSNRRGKSKGHSVRQRRQYKRAVQAAAVFAVPPPPPAATTATAALAGGSFSLQQCFAVALGYAVMLGSLFRSVPQIMKIIQAGSTEGLSLTSNIVELCCYTVVIAYNLSQGYAFNTFGEVVACWAQDVIIVGLIFRYSRWPLWAAAVASGAFAVACWALLSPWFPVQVLASLQAGTILTMALGSRLPQILLNIRRGNAGVLSVTTCLLNVLGNAARTFTTLILTGDMLLLGGVMTQGCLNSVLLYQSVTSARQSSRGGKQQQQQAMEPAAAVAAAAGGGSAGKLTKQSSSRKGNSRNSGGGAGSSQDEAPTAATSAEFGPALAPQPAM